MSYQKQIWNNGDIITDQKLNHIEEGIKNISNNFIQISVETIEDNNGDVFFEIKKTWQELYNLMQENNVLYFIMAAQYTLGLCIIMSMDIEEIDLTQKYWIRTNQNIAFYANSINDFPRTEIMK